MDGKFNFRINETELWLLRDAIGEFMLDFPDAEDVGAMAQRLTDVYHKEFEL